MNMHTWMISSAASLALLAGGCATTPAITDTAARTPQLSTLSKLIGDAGLTDTLRATGPFTVFAPTDEAFRAVPATTMAELGANKDLLKALLTYHVLPARVLSEAVKTGNAVTVNGANVALSKSGTFVTVEEAVVTQADVSASNGVVHIVDRVLIPPRR
jgi:uncharacterized surface protein with fasciclin (FAS1) repeats